MTKLALLVGLLTLPWLVLPAQAQGMFGPRAHVFPDLVLRAMA